jgi:hypothetical protein
VSAVLARTRSRPPYIARKHAPLLGDQARETFLMAGASASLAPALALALPPTEPGR